MKRANSKRKGQVLVMVTLGLFAMCGLLGLAVDLGWSFYVRKSAQAAADASSLAAVTEALARVGTADFVCGSNVTCDTTGFQCAPTVSDDAGNNLDNGCLYARQRPLGSGWYGFVYGANAGRQQSVIMTAHTDNPPIPVPALYWVRTRVGEQIPQLFSGIFGNFWGTSSARATAAVMSIALEGSLRLLDRSGDWLPMGIPGVPDGPGINISESGGHGQKAGPPPPGISPECWNADICAEGGIILASTRHGEAGPTWAGMVNGSVETYSSFTHTNRKGGQSGAVDHPDNWHLTPSPRGDGAQYLDPTRDLAQPPAPSVALADRWSAIDGKGNLVGYSTQAEADANPLPPGNYYVVKRDQQTGAPLLAGATGDPITVSGFVTFGSPGAFGDYVIFGGLWAAQGGATIKFGPGRYVFAGAKEKANSPGLVLNADKNLTLRDYSAATYYGETQDAGAIFIFTDARYPGLLLPQSPYWKAGLQNDLLQGQVNIQAGATSNTYVNLHAFNPDGAGAPAALKDYKKILFWQDRRNSFVDYGPDGRTAGQQVSGHIACGDFSDSCGKSLAKFDRDGMMQSSQWNSPKMTIQASQDVHLYGVIYQPRGAWLTMIGGSGYSGPLQLITGAVDIRGGASLTMQELQSTFTYRIAALVE